jgi:hypothetical protein
LAKSVDQASLGGLLVCRPRRRRAEDGLTGPPKAPILVKREQRSYSMNTVPIVPAGSDWANPPGSAHLYRLSHFKIPGIGARWYGTLDGEAVGIVVYGRLHADFHTKEALLARIAELIAPPVPVTASAPAPTTTEPAP